MEDIGNIEKFIKQLEGVNRGKKQELWEDRVREELISTSKNYEKKNLKLSEFLEVLQSAADNC